MQSYNSVSLGKNINTNKYATAMKSVSNFNVNQF